jgi:hypothetical protein
VPGASLVRSELVWVPLKRSLANLAKRNITQLTALVKTRPKKMQQRPGLLDGFPPAPGSTSHPFCNPTIEGGWPHHVSIGAPRTSPAVTQRCVTAA